MNEVAESVLGNRHGAGCGGADHDRCGRRDGAAVFHRHHRRAGFPADPAVALGCAKNRQAHGGGAANLGFEGARYPPPPSFLFLTPE